MIYLNGKCQYGGTTRRLCDNDICHVCFEKSFESHPKQCCWILDKNKISPRTVFKRSVKKYWLKCDKCFHIFDISPDKAYIGRWCPYCSGSAQKLCENINCNHCFNNSFASHEKSKYWLLDKNNNISPRMVAKNTHTKYWFKCNKCPHNISIALNNLNAGKWCPYCSDPAQKLCNDNCDHCFNNSFASHKKAKYWSLERNNNISPRMVFKKAHKRFWFKCDKCLHYFDILLNTPDNCWCPYCSEPPKRLCENINCNHCFNKSFASNGKSKCWLLERNNNISPRTVFLNSSEKFWFKCDLCLNDFEMNLGNVNCLGRWCPFCKNKTEGKLKNWLQNFPFSVIYQPYFDWCRNTITDKFLPFDFFIKDFNLIIELDGDQHFQQVSNWKSPEEIRKRDHYKEDMALQNNMTIIRLLQEDVWLDKNSWVEKLTKELYHHENPQILYLYDGENKEIHQKLELEKKTKLIIRKPDN